MFQLVAFDGVLWLHESRVLWRNAFAGVLNRVHHESCHTFWFQFLIAAKISRFAIEKIKNVSQQTALKQLQLHNFHLRFGIHLYSFDVSKVWKEIWIFGSRLKPLMTSSNQTRLSVSDCVTRWKTLIDSFWPTRRQQSKRFIPRRLTHAAKTLLNGIHLMFVHI